MAATPTLQFSPNTWTATFHVRRRRFCAKDIESEWSHDRRHHSSPLGGRHHRAMAALEEQLSAIRFGWQR